MSFPVFEMQAHRLITVFILYLKTLHNTAITASLKINSIL